MSVRGKVHGHVKTNTTQRFSRNEAKQRHRKLSIHNQHIVYNCIFNVLCKIVSLVCNGVLYRLCLVLVKYALKEDFILAFDSFVRSAWSFGLFIIATTANDLRLRRNSIPDVIHYIFVLSLFFRKRQYFSIIITIVNTWKCTSRWPLSFES